MFFNTEVKGQTNQFRNFGNVSTIWNDKWVRTFSTLCGIVLSWIAEQSDWNKLF